MVVIGVVERRVVDICILIKSRSSLLISSENFIFACAVVVETVVVVALVVDNCIRSKFISSRSRFL